eukprot:Clim_evm12s12 gene=Clim_evmTU12s12
MSKLKDLLKGAKDCLDTDRYEEALLWLKDAIAKDKNSYLAYTMSGAAFAGIGDAKSLDKAEQAYRKATDLKPDNPLAWRGLFKLYMDNIKYNTTKRAEVICDVGEHLRTLSSYSEQPVEKQIEILEALADAHADLGNQSQAMQIFMTLGEMYKTIENGSKAATAFARAATVYAGASVTKGDSIMEDFDITDEYLKCLKSLIFHLSQDRSRIEQVRASSARLGKGIVTQFLQRARGSTEAERNALCKAALEAIDQNMKRSIVPGAFRPHAILLACDDVNLSDDIHAIIEDLRQVQDKYTSAKGGAIGAVKETDDLDEFPQCSLMNLPSLWTRALQASHRTGTEEEDLRIILKCVKRLTENLDCLRYMKVETLLGIVNVELLASGPATSKTQALHILEDMDIIPALWKYKRLFIIANSVGDQLKAESALSKCLEIDNSDSELWLRQALLLAKSTEVDKVRALDAINQARKLSPQNALILRTWGTLHMKLCDDVEFRELQQDIQKAMLLAARRNADDPESFHVLGEYYERCDQSLQALKCYFKAVKLSPTTMYEMGEKLQDMMITHGEKGMQLELWQLLSESAPTGNATWASEAWGDHLFYTCRGFSGAAKAYHKALRGTEEQKNPWLWEKLGNAYMKMGQLPAAARSFLQAIDLYDDQSAKVGPSVSLAYSYYRQGQAAEGLEILQRLEASEVTMEPEIKYIIGYNSAIIHDYLHREMFLERRNGSACDHAMAAIRHLISCQTYAHADHTEILNMICRLTVSLFYNIDANRHLKDLASLLQEALGAQSSDALHDRKSILKAVLEHFKDCMASDPTTYTPRYNYSTVVLELMDETEDDDVSDLCEQALNVMSEAVVLRPDVPSGWELLGILALLNDEPCLAQHAFISRLKLRESSRGWCLLAILYYLQRNVQLAFECLHRGQMSDVLYGKVWTVQAVVAEDAGNFVEAVNLWRQSAALSTEVNAALGYAAIVHRLLQDPPGGVDEGAEALGQNDFQDALAGLRSSLAQNIKNGDEAKPLCNVLTSKLLEINGQFKTALGMVDAPSSKKSPEALFLKLRLMLRDAQTNFSGDAMMAALGDLEANIADDPKHAAEAAYYRGLIAYCSGQLDEAASELLQAVDQAKQAYANRAMDKHDVRTLYMTTLSLIALAAGDADTAQSILIESLELDPAYLEALEILHAMGIYMQNETVMDAAVAEYAKAPVDQLSQTRGYHRELLMALHAATVGKKDLATARIQAYIHAYPHDWRGWMDLTATLLTKDVAGCEPSTVQRIAKTALHLQREAMARQSQAWSRKSVQGQKGRIDGSLLMPNTALLPTLAALQIAHTRESGGSLRDAYYEALSAVHIKPWDESCVGLLAQTAMALWEVEGDEAAWQTLQRLPIAEQTGSQTWANVLQEYIASHGPDCADHLRQLCAILLDQGCGMLAVQILVHSLTVRGQYDAAAVLLEAAAAEEHDAATPQTAANLSLQRAYIAMLRGDVAAAQKFLQDAKTVSDSAPRSLETSVALYLRGVQAGSGQKSHAKQSKRFLSHDSLLQTHGYYRELITQSESKDDDSLCRQESANLWEAIKGSASGA